MEILVTNHTIFARFHMWFKHAEKLEHIVANYHTRLSIKKEASNLWFSKVWKVCMVFFSLFTPVSCQNFPDFFSDSLELCTNFRDFTSSLWRIKCVCKYYTFFLFSMYTFPDVELTFWRWLQHMNVGFFFNVSMKMQNEATKASLHYRSLWFSWPFENNEITADNLIWETDSCKLSEGFQTLD